MQLFQETHIIDKNISYIKVQIFITMIFYRNRPINPFETVKLVLIHRA